MFGSAVRLLLHAYVDIIHVLGNLEEFLFDSVPFDTVEQSKREVDGLLHPLVQTHRVGEATFESIPRQVCIRVALLDMFLGVSSGDLKALMACQHHS